MAIGLQNRLNKFQFERTVDWRANFKNLFASVGHLKDETSKSILKMARDSYDDGQGNSYIFATNTDAGVGKVTVAPDSAGVPGFFHSGLTYPPLSLTLYTDAFRGLETILSVWNNSAFLSNGMMPISITGENGKDLIRADGGKGVINPTQKIWIDRINPVKVSRSLLSLVYDVPGIGTKKRNEINEKADILIRYEYDVYLLKEPNYSGSNEGANLRTVSLSLGVAGFRKLDPTGTSSWQSTMQQNLNLF